MNAWDRLIAALFGSTLEKLVKQQYTDLTAQVAALQTQVTTATQNLAALKTNNDALVADNGAKQTAIDSLNASIAQLQADLAAAQAAASSPDELQAVQAAVVTLAQLVQALSDANTVNSPTA